MTIRPAALEDHPALLKIWRRSVEATHDFLSETDIVAIELLVRDQALPNLEVWVLSEEDGRPVGFMGLDGRKVEALFVDPGCFGRGGGRLLLAHARRLKGPLLVDVNEQNPRAEGFYLASGFKVTGRSALDAEGRPFPILHLAEDPL